MFLADAVRHAIGIKSLNGVCVYNNQLADFLNGKTTKIRLDCPKCSHIGTLSITLEKTTLLWNCYSASCSFKGATTIKLTLYDIARNLKNKIQQQSTPKEFAEPKHFVRLGSGAGYSTASTFLIKNKCWYAYQEKLIEIRYDPRMDRVVFMLKDPRDNKIVGAIGKQLDRNANGPKWYKYPNSASIPFICGHGTTAIIVEDPASACAASYAGVGFALLGTDFDLKFRPFLRNFTKAVLALDKDATTKSYRIVQDIRDIIPVKIKYLQKDLKDCDISVLQNLLNGNPNA